MIARKLIVAAVVSALLAGNHVEVRAISSGSIVYDPANHAENIISAIQSLRANVLSEAQLAQEIISAVNTGKQYVQMIKDYQLQIKAMRSMSPSQIFGLAKQLGGEVAVYADIAERVSRTDRNLRSVLEAYKDIERLGNYTSMTPEQIFWAERNRRWNQNAYTRDRFTNIQRILTAVNADIPKINELRWAIPDYQGEGEQSMRAAMENVSMHLNLMAGQNTQLLALFAEESAAKSASGVSERALSEAQEYNNYVKQWQQEWLVKQRFQAAMQRAQQAWRTIP